MDDNKGEKMKTESIRYETRERAKELLRVFTKLCNEMNIEYSLGGMSLWSADNFNGFGDIGYTISVMLLYQDYDKIYKKCIELYGRERSDIYVLDEYNCEEFNQFGFQLRSKSGVVLPESSKSGEKYYDYYIIITPIYYAGDTLKEYNELVEKYKKANYLMNVKAPVPYAFRLKRMWERIRNKYYSSKYSDSIYIEMKKVLETNKDETRYVFLPTNNEQKDSVRLLSTYKRTVEISYDGIMAKKILDSELWVQDFYGEQLEKIISKPQNAAQLKGPEILRKVQKAGLENLIEFDRVCRKYDIKYVITGGTLLGAVRHGGFIPWDDDIDVSMLYEEYLKFEKVADKELDKSKFFLQNQSTDKDMHLVFPTIRRQGSIYSKPGRTEFDTHRGIALDILILFTDAPTRIQRYIQDRICKTYKTLTWGHMEHEKFETIKWKTFYKLAKKKGGNKYTYSQFIKWATKYENRKKQSKGRLTYLLASRNPYNSPFTRRETYENIIDIEFEGHMFKAPENYIGVLTTIFGRDYMRFPSMPNRKAKHLPGEIKLPADS